MTPTVTSDLITLADGIQGTAEWVYQVFVWSIGLGLFVCSLVLAYRTLFMDIWSSRTDYIGLHVCLGAAATVGWLTAFWPHVNQGFLFTLTRGLLLAAVCCYISVTHREGMAFHVPGYQRKPREPEPESTYEDQHHG